VVMDLLRRHLSAFVGLGITVVFLALFVLRPGLVWTLDLKLYDLMMGLRGVPPDPASIVLVQIDDKSLEQMGPLPWPAARIAQGLRDVSKGKPKAVGLDVASSALAGNKAMVEELKGLEALFAKEVLGKEGEAGSQILEAIAKARSRLQGEKALSDAIREAGNVVIPVRPGQSAARGGDLTPMGIKQRLLDRDGILRREPLLHDDHMGHVPSYGLALAMQGLGLQADAISTGKSRVRIGPLDIPTDPSFAMWINFRGPSGSFEICSFSDVIAGAVRPGAFSNAVALIHVSASGHGHRVQTPMGPMPEGELAGNIVETIMGKAFIRQPGWGFYAGILGMLAIGAMIALVFPGMGRAVSGTAALGLFLALSGVGVWMFVFKGLWVPMACPLLLLVFGYAGAAVLKQPGTRPAKEKTASVSPETNRLLALTFYKEGMLDMAFDKLRLVPVDDETKKTLYAIGLDYEKKKQFAKAVAVYEYIEAHDSQYRDVQKRKRNLMTSSETMVLGDSISGDLASGQEIRGLQTLGRYRIIKEIGRGAMGRVYLGKDPRINRATAIKAFQFSEDFEPEEVQKMKDTFFREAESAGTLSHANIVTIYDAGEEKGLAYIAMEYLDGHSLDQYTKKGTLLPMRKVMDYVADIADALHYAHEKGIVHRDIKPANVMLLTNGTIKITDFGIARITATSQTQAGVVKGTPFYMSPEQFSGAKVDGRSDIFSLGVMLFQLLTGTLPFTGKTPVELLQKVMKEPHPDPRQFNPKIVAPLVKIMDKALEKDRDKRYQDAAHMASHLRVLGKRIDEAIAKWRASKNKA